MLVSHTTVAQRLHTFDGDEVSPALVGDGLRQQRLSAPGRAVQEHASRYRQA